MRSGRTNAAATRCRTSHWWSSDPGSGTTGAAPLWRIRSRSSGVVARASSANPFPATSSNQWASGSTAVRALADVRASDGSREREPRGLAVQACAGRSATRCGPGARNLRRAVPTRPPAVMVRPKSFSSSRGDTAFWSPFGKHPATWLTCLFRWSRRWLPTGGRSVEGPSWTAELHDSLLVPTGRAGTVGVSAAVAVGPRG
jgi:hypothetical protein